MKSKKMMSKMATKSDLKKMRKEDAVQDKKMMMKQRKGKK